MADDEDDLTQRILEDLTSRILRTAFAQDYEISEVVAGRLNRAVNRYLEDTGHRNSAQLREKASDSKADLTRIQNACSELEAAFDAAKPNPYVVGRLLDALGGPAADGLQDDACLQQLNDFRERLTQVAAAAAAANRGDGRGNRLPTFKPGKQPTPALGPLIDTVFDIVDEAITAARRKGLVSLALPTHRIGTKRTQEFDQAVSEALAVYDRTVRPPPPNFSLVVDRVLGKGDEVITHTQRKDLLDALSGCVTEIASAEETCQAVSEVLRACGIAVSPKTVRNRHPLSR